MTPPDEPRPEAQVPAALEGSLRRLASPPALPEGFDRELVGNAHSLLGARRRRRRFRRLAGAGLPLAAAAALLLWWGLARTSGEERLPEALARLDLDGSGRFDILDAYHLARELDRGRELAHWDPAVGRPLAPADVPALAREVVRLDR